MRPGESVTLMSNGITTQVREVGIFSPEQKPVAQLEPGQVGYLVGTIKDPGDVVSGDTITTTQAGSDKPLPGFKEVRFNTQPGDNPVYIKLTY